MNKEIEQKRQDLLILVGKEIVRIESLMEDKEKEIDELKETYDELEKLLNSLEA